MPFTALSGIDISKAMLRVARMVARREELQDLRTKVDELLEISKGINESKLEEHADTLETFPRARTELGKALLELECYEAAIEQLDAAHMFIVNCLKALQLPAAAITVTRGLEQEDGSTQEKAKSVTLTPLAYRLSDIDSEILQLKRLMEGFDVRPLRQVFLEREASLLIGSMHVSESSPDHREHFDVDSGPRGSVISSSERSKRFSILTIPPPKRHWALKLDFVHRGIDLADVGIQ